MNKKSLLIFDSDSNYLQLVSSFFQIQGYRVVVARKVTDCISKLDRQQFSCLVIDANSLVHVEKVISVTSQSGQMNQNVPVLLTTIDEQVISNLSLEVHSHIQLILTKPFEMTDIFGAVEKLTQYNYE